MIRWYDMQTDNKLRGQNILPEKPRASNQRIFLNQVQNPLIYVLLIAAAITIFIGHFSDAIIIALAVMINTILGFVQERKATNALYALKQLVSSNAIVIQDGKHHSIDVKDLIPGDIVFVTQGSKIPADGVLVSANRLFIDESLLTGESQPVTKVDGGELYMGTIVSSGQAQIRITSIGANTKMGKIAGQIQEDEEDTPLQKQLKVFSQQLVVVVLALSCSVIVIGLVRGFTLIEVFITSVALAVSSIPEGLIVSLTVVLAIGMQKIVRRQGLVRKLSAAETLGGVSVICVDKTGTLTQGKMTVVSHRGDEEQLAVQVVLANDLDDPIVIAAGNWGASILGDHKPKHVRLDSIPFNSHNRFFMSLHRWSSNANKIFVNGAPEMVLDWTNLPDSDKQVILKTINEYTSQGKRLIGYAHKDVATTKTQLVGKDAKSGLTWVGLLVFSDPVRSSVKESLAEATSAGIRTIVITGDYANTAQHVLSELGILLQKDEVLLGEELAMLNANELSKRVKSIKLFARTTPDQKLLIVNALKLNKEVVAMMGDGVNDAPALHAADIGISVGEGTDVAKESANLVLLDSNFKTIIAAIEEGRVMFDNIRKIILYLMSDAFGEIVVVLGGMLLGLPLPITAVQILWINLVSDGFPSLALAIDPKREGSMSERPRSSTEKIVNSWMIKLIATVSISTGLIALSAFSFIYNQTGDLILARSMAFLLLGLNSLSYVFSVRLLMTPFWQDNIFKNKWLFVAVGAGFILQSLPFLSASLRHFFGVTTLSLPYWILAIASSISVFFIVEIFKYFYNHKPLKQ